MIGPVRRNIGGNVVAALANFLGGITVLLEVACEFCEQFRASSVPTVGDSRLASVIEILDSLGDSASKIWNVARWTADRIWNADCKNEVHALLDQNGVTISGSPFTNEGREVLTDLDLDRPSELLLEQWLALIDDLDEKITQLDREIEQVAVSVPELELLMTVPGISTYSGLLIHAEIGEVERFDRANEVVSYAGLDPVVRESPDSRTEGGISKEGNSYLRWILVQCANTAVHNSKDPYLSEFYWRLRGQKNKPHKVAIVATAREMLVSIFHMLSNEEVYDPPGVST